MEGRSDPQDAPGGRGVEGVGRCRVQLVQADAILVVEKCGGDDQECGHGLPGADRRDMIDSPFHAAGRRNGRPTGLAALMRRAPSRRGLGHEAHPTRARAGEGGKDEKHAPEALTTSERHPLDHSTGLGCGQASLQDIGLADDERSVFHWVLMRRANRPVALALLLMAVLCSPAGVCAIDAMAATGQAAASTHAHACCKSGDGTFLAASDDPCCAESRSGFVHVFRFTLQKHVATLPLEFDLRPAAPTRLLAFCAVERRAPLVLRI